RYDALRLQTINGDLGSRSIIVANISQLHRLRAPKITARGVRNASVTAGFLRGSGAVEDNNKERRSFDVWETGDVGERACGCRELRERMVLFQWGSTTGIPSTNSANTESKQSWSVCLTREKFASI
ncbi:hypothetical protein PspLS_01148, partial [Pyricularia sp. CBS 133598]